MHNEAHFSWFQYIPFLAEKPYHVVAAGTVVLFLMVFTLLGRVALAGAKEKLIPAERINFFGIFDLIAEGLYKLTQMVLGDAAKDYLPVVGALFLYVFVGNLMGLLPGFAPPTDNVNTTLACGLFAFLYYNFQGFKHGGISYAKHFLGPVWYMAWMLLPIEIIAHAVRPFTLALRLKGNMEGDHTVLASFTDMVPYGVPVAVYFLGLLVCFLQAFIFVMLTMVYVSMARDSSHH